MQVEIHANGKKVVTGTVVIHSAQQLAPGRSTKEWAQVTIGDALQFALLPYVSGHTLELVFNDGSRRGFDYIGMANGVVEGELR